MRKSSTKGFALAELLIVAAIIAVLVLIAIPVFTVPLNRSKAAADEATARSLYAAMQSDFLASDSQVGKYTPAESYPGKATYETFDKTTTNEFNFSGVCDSLTVEGGKDGAGNIIPVKIVLVVKDKYLTDEKGEPTNTVVFGD